MTTSKCSVYLPPIRFLGKLWLAIALISSLAAGALSQEPPGGPPPQGGGPRGGEGQPAPQRMGLVKNEPGAFPGYTLIAPMQSTMTYLVDMEGRVVRSWKSDSNPGHSAYLLDNGHMLRAGEIRNAQWGQGPGAGGKLQEFTFDGEIVWEYTYSTENRLPHHDFVKLPNGNVIMVIREKKTAEDCIAAGRRPAAATELQPDALIEVKPTGPTSGEIVWEWHIWDHMVQDHDNTKANFGEVAKHPELVDVNFGSGILAAMVNDPAGREQLRSIGYLGGAGGEGDNRGRGDGAGRGDGGGRGPGDGGGRGDRGGRGAGPRGGRGGGGPGRGGDWTHVNAVAYNADLDQVMISVHEFSEIWIIDHSTTKEQAAGHTGGKQGKGGDLLYRWGNPRAYRAGDVNSQTLYAQHCAHWIAKGLPGEGHILLFNNGNGRRDGQYSTVDEIVLPVNADGSYKLEAGKSYGPEAALWSYSAPNRTDFFSNFISGAQRLPNGNTLVCTGASGVIFEVTPDKQMVWQFINPTRGGRGGPGGGPGGFGGPGPGGPGGGPNNFGGPGGPGFGGPGAATQIGQVLQGFMQDAMQLTSDQREKVQAVQKDVDDTLKAFLTDEQEKQLDDLRSGTGGFGGVPQPGQILSAVQQSRLNLTDEQKPKMEELQKKVDGRLADILNEDQRGMLTQGGRGFGPGGGQRGPGGGGRGFADGGGRGGPAGRGGPGGRGGGPGGGSVFRVYRYAADFPGLKGKDLTPGKTMQELTANPEGAPQ